MNKELIITLIGVKILIELFKKDKLKWKLVVQKSKKILFKALGLHNIKEVDTLVSEYNII
jgi:hypothetical protein